MVTRKLFVFIEFNNLTKIKIKSLNNKACKKIYILINDAIEQLPLSLTKQILALGLKVKFIGVPDFRESDQSLHISLIIGTLHQKVAKNIEFAIISDNPAFQSIAAKLKQSNRKCEIVGIGQATPPKNKGITQISMPLDKPVPQVQDGNRSSNDTVLIASKLSKHVEKLTALAVDETIKAFDRTDKWPSTVEKLRYFISLYVEEYAKHVNLDDIIDRLVDIGKIKINEQDEVVYYRRRELEPNTDN